MLITALAVLAVFAGALTRSTFGFGEAVVAMPLLVLLPVGLHTAASLVGLVGLVVAVLSVVGARPQVDRAALLRLSVGTVAGLPLGLVLLLAVPARPVTAALGALLVLYGGYGLLPRALPGRAGLGWAYPTGMLAGALGTAYNVTGVPVAVYGIRRGWRPGLFRGTLQAHFVISGALVVLAQALGGVWTPALPRLLALSLPAVVVATWLGHRLHRLIPAERFTRAVHLLVLALGALLVARAAAGAL